MDNNTFVQLFSSYWWLIFPLGWMIMSVFGMIGHYRHKSETLKLIKTYADQGKDVPPALLDAMKGDDHGDRDDYRRGRYRGYRRGPWAQFVVFACLSSGFGFAGYYGHFGEANTIFLGLAVAFGIASFAMLVGGIISMMQGKN